MVKRASGERSHRVQDAEWHKLVQVEFVVRLWFSSSLGWLSLSASGGVSAFLSGISAYLSRQHFFQEFVFLFAGCCLVGCSRSSSLNFPAFLEYVMKLF